MQSIELGLKFKSDVTGSVTGVRFYKDLNNTGIHTGSLWSSSGTLLVVAGEDPTLNAILVCLLQTSGTRRDVVLEFHQHVAADPRSFVPEGVSPRHEISSALGSHVH